MKVIDCHMHIFPFLGSACGWESADAHLDYLQKFMYSAANPGVVGTALYNQLQLRKEKSP